MKYRKPALKNTGSLSDSQIYCPNKLFTRGTNKEINNF